MTQVEREFLHGQKSTLVLTLGSRESWVEIGCLQKAVETLCAYTRVRDPPEAFSFPGGPGASSILVAESQLGPMGVLKLEEKSGHPACWELCPPENRLGFSASLSL